MCGGAALVFAGASACEVTDGFGVGVEVGFEDSGKEDVVEFLGPVPAPNLGEGVGVGAGVVVLTAGGWIRTEDGCTDGAAEEDEGDATIWDGWFGVDM